MERPFIPMPDHDPNQSHQHSDDGPPSNLAHSFRVKRHIQMQDWRFKGMLLFGRWGAKIISLEPWIFKAWIECV